MLLNRLTKEEKVSASKRSYLLDQNGKSSSGLPLLYWPGSTGGSPTVVGCWILLAST